MGFDDVGGSVLAALIVLVLSLINDVGLAFSRGKANISKLTVNSRRSGACSTLIVHKPGEPLCRKDGHSVVFDFGSTNVDTVETCEAK